jgi:hypothetical protein
LLALERNVRPQPEIVPEQADDEPMAPGFLLERRR